MFLSDLEDGSSIFVDANIFVYHFSKGSKFNPASTNFLEHVEKGHIVGVSSTSIVQEVAHRMMIREAATTIVGIKAKDFVKHLKAHSDFERVSFIKLYKPSVSTEE